MEIAQGIQDLGGEEVGQGVFNFLVLGTNSQM